jgi:23S rRNA G2445 N2-methylase RlmL
VADEGEAEAIARACARSPEGTLALLQERLATPPSERAHVRLLRLAGRLGADPARAMLVRALLVSALRAPAHRVARAAATALARVGGPDEEAEGALLAAWEAHRAGPERRAIATALGHVGGARALELLRTIPEDDTETGPAAAKARLKLERTASRPPPTEPGLRMDAPMARPVRVLFRTRSGLEHVLAEEATERLGIRALPTAEGVVTVETDAPLARLLEVRTAIDLGADLPLASGRTLAERIAGTLARERDGVFRAWARAAPVRFRLEFADAGHRRRDVWAVAEAARKFDRELMNDPVRAPFVVRVDEAKERLRIAPRVVPDPRFAYRVAEVPAASHPAVAAALARVGGVRREDVVWDPFVGSGLELVERARLGPWRALIGSDTDARALAAARANLEAAGASATLRLADARDRPKESPTLIVTNPPMGRRVPGDIGALLRAFIANVAMALAPGGRLVWLSPRARETADAGRAAGLRVERLGAVDLGGLCVELQRMTR